MTSTETVFNCSCYIWPSFIAFLDELGTIELPFARCASNILRNKREHEARSFLEELTVDATEHEEVAKEHMLGLKVELCMNRAHMY